MLRPQMGFFVLLALPLLLLWLLYFTLWCVHPPSVVNERNKLIMVRLEDPACSRKKHLPVLRRGRKKPHLAETKWRCGFLRYTLFMPIKACSGIDSRSSKDPVTADSEGSPEESPNTTHESTKSPPHLAVALDSVSSLEQPLRYASPPNSGFHLRVVAV
jgi:hypothetical protein